MRFDEAVEELMKAHGWPRWVAHLTLELVCLESWAALRRLRARGVVN